MHAMDSKIFLEVLQQNYPHQIFLFREISFLRPRAHRPKLRHSVCSILPKMKANLGTKILVGHSKQTRDTF